MKKPRAGLVILDLIILSGSYVFMAGLKPVMVNYLNTKYLIGFGITLFLWRKISGKKERRGFYTKN